MERNRWTLLAVPVATVKLLLDTTIVTVALPSIRADPPRLRADPVTPVTCARSDACSTAAF
jgi:hypothetical protein